MLLRSSVQEAKRNLKSDLLGSVPIFTSPNCFSLLFSLSRGWGTRIGRCRLLAGRGRRVALPAPPASLPFPSPSQHSPGIHELQFNSSALEFQQTRSCRERRERRAPCEEGPWVNISTGPAWEDNLPTHTPAQLAEAKRASIPQGAQEKSEQGSPASRDEATAWSGAAPSIKATPTAPIKGNLEEEARQKMKFYCYRLKVVLYSTEEHGKKQSHLWGQRKKHFDPAWLKAHHQSSLRCFKRHQEDFNV